MKLSKNIEKNVITCLKLKFFQIFGIFPTCFGCFLPTDTADKNTSNFAKPYHCSIQSLMEIGCDWDLMPSTQRLTKMSLEISSLVFIMAQRFFQVIVMPGQKISMVLDIDNNKWLRQEEILLN